MNNIKRYWVWISLVVTLILVILAPDSEVVHPKETFEGVSRSIEAGSRSGRILSLNERNTTVTNKNLFLVVEAPPVVIEKTMIAEPPVMPLKEVAPELPFKVIGSYKEDGDLVVFLQHHEDTIFAKSGDVVLSKYKISDISSGSVSFLYLPLNEYQNVSFSSSL